MSTPFVRVPVSRQSSDKSLVPYVDVHLRDLSYAIAQACMLKDNLLLLDLHLQELLLSCGYKYGSCERGAVRQRAHEQSAHAQVDGEVDLPLVLLCGSPQLEQQAIWL